MPVNKTMEQYAHYIAIACYVTKSASNWNHCDWITIPAESDRRKHESVFGLSCCGSNCTSIEYQRILVLSLLSIGALMKNEKKTSKLNVTWASSNNATNWAWYAHHFHRLFILHFSFSFAIFQPFYSGTSFLIENKSH